ncbi:hypothetical protein QBC43DRAFT_209958 [Cladorrhinum sp. PSN259]|nr:hypothetical protein QBC43DRAFT_209958 [Cladorrhinum sp. PSN259]
MSSILLLRICFVSACAYTLLNQRDSRLLNVHRAAVVARRTTRFTAPHWRYRPRRRRTSWSTYHLSFLRKPLHSFSPHKHHQSSQDHNMEEPIAETSSAHKLRRQQSARRANRSGSPDETRPRRIPDEVMSTPPPPHTDELIENRSSRSASSASRSTNRLSLTLPIAPPSPHPSRPAPMSITAATFPPTPLDTPALMSPVDSTDFITAIAAQERRVLELREDLARAESDLANLKKQYANYEAYKKKGARRNAGSTRSHNAATVPHDEVAIRRSVELDRRKALLGQQNQQSQQATPEKSRRRVFTGGHTRTLSLLSPTKPSGGFDEPDDATTSRISYDSLSPSQYAPVTPSLLAKRASWAPRTTQQTSGVKQIAQDLKSGIWTFMEDLRQATVGDEPITGQGMYLRGSDGNMRATMSEFGDHDTIRASTQASRPRATSAFEDPAAPGAGTDERSNNDDQTDSSSNSKPVQPLRRSKTTSDATKATKRFSWQPLPADSIDDNDWSNWDSPSVVSPTSRWSGTTINGDIIPAVPEKLDDSETTALKKQSSRSSQLTTTADNLAQNKLEDLFPQVLNHLTPSNIKKTANKFLNEWEKSLTPPPDFVTTANATAGGNKVKGT